MELETVIGLEVHVQLDTKTKAFCGCSTEFGKEANTQTCPVCLGLPGSLPVLNKKALEHGIKTALALNCTVQNFVKFDRKNYFYPDLPKNYQISQFSLPLSSAGYIEIETTDGFKRISIRRVHLEEDAGKLIHEEDKPSSLVDYNRAGMPLMEIVSEPDLNSPDEAYEYLTKLKLILQYLKVSDCDMEKGSLRCDANISVREKGSSSLGTKSELKNMNSFKAVKSALQFEVDRHKQIIKNKGKIIQETRLWDENKEITVTMRTKEEAHDYRYFPEPDLLPFVISKEQIDNIQKDLPELPGVKIKRLLSEYSLPKYDASILIQDINLASFFEECVKIYPKAKIISNWIMGSVLSELNAKKITINELGLEPVQLIELIRLVENGTLSNLTSKEVLKDMIDSKKPAAMIIREKNLVQISDTAELKKIISQIISENSKSTQDYQNGKENALMFLVGQVMKQTQGKANPKVAKDLLQEQLNRKE